MGKFLELFTGKSETYLPASNAEDAAGLSRKHKKKKGKNSAEHQDQVQPVEVSLGSGFRPSLDGRLEDWTGDGLAGTSTNERLVDGKSYQIQFWNTRQQEQAQNFVDLEPQTKLSNLQERYRGEIEHLKREHSYKLKVAEKELESRHQFEMRETMKAKDREIDGIRKACDDSVAKRDETMHRLWAEKDRNKDEYERQSKQLSTHHSVAMDALKASHASELSSQVAKYEETVAASRKTLQDLMSEHKADTMRLQAEHAESLEKQDEDHTITVSKLETTLRNQEVQSQEEHKQLSEKHAREVAELNTTMESQAHLFEEKKRELNKTHVEEISRLRISLEDQKKALEKQFQVETKVMSQRVQQLSDALMARDDRLYQAKLFKSPDQQKNDRQLQDDFMGLQKSVEELGALQWSHGQRLWPEEALRRANGNYGRRVVRKAILQDIIWTKLFQYVFASPFRVFGQEGRTIEADWLEQCGNDSFRTEDTYIWPPITVQAERWRYMTIKECQEAIRSPLPSEWDPRARLRKGSAENMRIFVEELGAELRNVVDVDAQVKERLTRLYKRAAAIWLDFGMHRCRVVVQLPGSTKGSMSEKAAQVKQGSGARMTVLPIVGRHGNAKGVELDKFTTIGDCKGDSLELP